MFRIRQAAQIKTQAKSGRIERSVGIPCRRSTRRWEFRRCFLALALGAVLAPALGPRPATGQIGIVAGYNRDMLQDLVVADGFRLDDEQSGFHLGIFLNVNVGTFAIRPAVLYHRIVDVDVLGPGAAKDFDLEIVEVPLDFLLRLPVPIVHPYFLAGPVFMFPSSPEESVDAVLETGPTRIDVGIGFEWNFGFRLWPEVRYGFGVNQFMGTEFPLGDDTFSATGEPSLDTFMVRVGISF